MRGVAFIRNRFQPVELKRNLCRNTGVNKQDAFAVFKIHSMLDLKLKVSEQINVFFSFSQSWIYGPRASSPRDGLPQVKIRVGIIVSCILLEWSRVVFNAKTLRRKGRKEIQFNRRDAESAEKNTGYCRSGFSRESI